MSIVVCAFALAVWLVSNLIVLVLIALDYVTYPYGCWTERFIESMRNPRTYGDLLLDLFYLPLLVLLQAFSGIGRLLATPICKDRTTK